MTTGFTDTQVAELNVAFDRLAFQLSQIHLHQHTIQLLNRSREGMLEYQPGGSGVLVQKGDRYFIFTAAHVTENVYTEGLFVNTRIGVRHIEGTLDETDYHLDMMVDIAYLEIERPFAILLAESYAFLPFEKIEPGHTPSLEARYMVSGYPEKNIRADPETHTVTTGSSHFVLTMAGDKPYEFYHVPREVCFVLNFAGAGIDLQSGKKEKGIQDPYGISGCGLWRLILGGKADKMSLDYRLIGIMFMVKKGKYHVLIGNRIELIAQQIGLA